MVEIKIVKKTIVTVADKEENQYGDIIFHDREGNQYKLGVKRAHLDEKLVVGQAVELGWGRYKDETKSIEYIADVKLVSEELPTPPQKKPEAKPLPKPEPIKYAPQEIGMWLKALGDRIGDGSLARDYPQSCVSITQQWYDKCWAVTGITPKKD